MVEYFSSEHFKLLNKWKNQRRDESIPEQNRAYEELVDAYKVTEAWAQAVRQQLFPTGKVGVRKRPTSQANTFLPYNWARIYPSQDAPEELAYTVGIDAEKGFVVKIDTMPQVDPALRRRYDDIRGAFDNNSPIVATMSAVEGLSMSLAELTVWSVDAIRGFRLRYEDVADKLQLRKRLADEEVLSRFDGKPAFKALRESWSPQDRALFCRMARIVHSAGLDWWHMGPGRQVRFGRKNPGSERAVGVLGIIVGARALKIYWTRKLGGLPALEREPLTPELVSRIEAALTTGHPEWEEWPELDAARPGFWPDQLREDPSDPNEVSDEEVAPIAAKSRAPFNRIYYGPPGTGKTYQLSQLLKQDYEQGMPSVSIEEARSQVIAEKIAVLKWWEGAAAALYDLGGAARVGDLAAHPFVQAIVTANGSNRHVRQTLWQTLQNHAVEDSTTVRLKKRRSPAIFDKSADSVWKFAGDWEDACADLVDLVDQFKRGHKNTGSVQRYTFVTFHQSYGYEEFVEGLRPRLDGESESGEIQYEIREGAFKELCRKARLAPDQRFAMVVDEINRGNISKIFGELITLIEIDKREGAENALSVTLPYSGESFSVPANVDIIGTMNTADRSLALLDTALRRRFDFVPLMPDARNEPGAPLNGLQVTVNEKMIDIPKMLTAINRRVEALYDRDHTIGHAYFTEMGKIPDGEQRFTALQQIFRNRIVPLLEEYFFEDWHKIRLVLADHQKDKAACFVTVGLDHEDEIVGLFGSDHGLDIYSIRKRYGLQDHGFSNPDAYIGIYQTLSR